LVVKKLCSIKPEKVAEVLAGIRKLLS